jgi:DNA invertase Pin-like site-specific DNA recombinase
LGQVAIYCRVSTDDQSCERQERDLRAFAKRSGHEIVAIFRETASGAKNDRAERKKVMALAQARKIDNGTQPVGSLDAGPGADP